MAQCPQGPDVFARDSEHAGAVISFLIDFTKRHHRIRIKQICEVVNLLLSCPAWVAALDVSPMLRDRIRSELPEEIQAAFALQNRHLEASVTDRARTKAKDITDASLRQARKVAGDMHSIRHSIWIQPSSPEQSPLDSVEEEHSGVEPELSDAPKGAHEDKYQAVRDQAKATGAKAAELTKEYGPKALEGMKGLGVLLHRTFLSSSFLPTNTHARPHNRNVKCSTQRTQTSSVATRNATPRSSIPGGL